MVCCEVLSGYKYSGNGGGGGWGWSGIYPIFVEYPVQVINVNNSPSEFMQNINQEIQRKECILHFHRIFFCQE